MHQFGPSPKGLRDLSGVMSCGFQNLLIVVTWSDAMPHSSLRHDRTLVSLRLLYLVFRRIASWLTLIAQTATAKDMEIGSGTDSVIR
jgi:hypothetical protein